MKAVVVLLLPVVHILGSPTIESIRGLYEKALHSESETEKLVQQLKDKKVILSRIGTDHKTPVKMKQAIAVFIKKVD